MIKTYGMSQTQTFSVEKLRSELHKATEKQKIFEPNQKCDASEAFLYLIEHLHEELKSKSTNESLVHQIFHTNLTRTVACKNCKTEFK
jgi:uncharacterized UBP type Zn finger protein